MTLARVLRSPLIAIIACAPAALPSRAAPPSQDNDAPASAQHHDSASLPSARSMIAPQASTLEDDLAQLVQKRDGVPPGATPWMDLKIDSRIFARWLLTQAAGGTEQGSEQVSGYLHAVSMLAVIPIVDDYASKQSTPPNTAQSVGMTRFHQFTYQLKDAKDIAALDAASAEVAQDILLTITPMQGGDRLPALVAMRPNVSPSSVPAQDRAAEHSGPKTVDELAALARQASVSPQLRHQLISMATLAQQAQADPAHLQEAQTLARELEDALDLTAGLQANTAVTTQEREQIELHLSDALALFSDPRMREAGRTRLASLDQYRQLLGRVEQMQVPPELGEALAPALRWVHEHPDQGDNVLTPVEKFLRLDLAHKDNPQQPDEFAALRPNDPLRRAYDELNKQFAKAHGDFLSDAADIGSGNIAGSGLDSLSDHVNAMARLEDLLDLLIAMPRTIQTLDAFKPRPSGGIEHRVKSTLLIIDSPIKSPAREEAARQLKNLQKLADAADQLADQPVGTISPAVVQAYAGDQIAVVQTKWKSMVMEMASAFSANQPMDAGKFDRLKAVRELLDALGPVTAMEAASANPEGLTAWADWTVTPAQIHALMQPYQNVMSQAFAGFISDNRDAQVAFARFRPHYEPMMSLFTRTGGYADACSKLPQGTIGLLARLATPYARSPFAEQRFASFIAAQAASANDDPSVIEAAATAISNRVGR